jgi:MFS transporter, FSR family, fosmidomycin resistance protein
VDQEDRTVALKAGGAYPFRPSGHCGVVPGDRRVLLTNSIYHLTNDGTVTIVAGEITLLQVAFTFGAFETGVLSGMALLVTALFQIVFGIVSDRRDPPRFLPLGIVILGAGSLLVALSTSFWMLLALIALSRIGASFYHPVGIAWIGREFRGPDLDRAMGFQSAFGDTGVILGMATTSLVAVSLGGWQVPFLLWGIINLGAVALGLRLLRHYRSPIHDPRPTRPDYRRMIREVRPWLFLIALGGAAFTIFTTFGPLLLHHKFGFDDTSSEVAIAMWILVGALVAFFFGRVSRRFGRLRTLTVSYGCVAVASVVGAASGLPWVVLLVFWTLGSAVFITYPALFSFVAEASHERLQGATFGVIFGFQLLGGSLGSFAAGGFAAALRSVADLDSTAPFYLLGLLAAAGFVYLFAIRSRIGNAGAGEIRGLTTV